MFTEAVLALLADKFPGLTFSHPESWCMVARCEDRSHEVQVVHHYDGGLYHIHDIGAKQYLGVGNTLAEALTDLLSRAYHREPARYTGASN